jgi:hypothetical protein
MDKTPKKRGRKLCIVLLDLEDACDTLERHLRLLEDCFYNFVDGSSNSQKKLAQLGTLSEIFEPVISSDLEEVRQRIKEARKIDCSQAD